MINIRESILLAPYTSFKIGGPAKYFSEAKSVEEIQELCQWAKNKKVPIFVLGGGSNVLISDKGFDGLVIKIENSKSKISAKGGSASGGKNSTIECEAGVSLAKLVIEATKNNLAGLEWAMGIPGTVGGAINGNAGAFGRSISEAVDEVRVIDISNCKLLILSKKECGFNYRNSIFKNNFNLIILSAVFRLKKGNGEEMKKTIKDFTLQRIKSNPNGYSAGCFFKNIDWQEAGGQEEFIKKFPELKQFLDKPKISVGFLIDQVGLKNKKVGGAVVSEKHAAFIINDGKATANDVINLSNLVKEKVFERYGLNLEEEVVVV